MLLMLRRNGIDVRAPLEHCLVPGLIRHAFFFSMPPKDRAAAVGAVECVATLLLEHPIGCDCTLLPDQVLLEG